MSDNVRQMTPRFRTAAIFVGMTVTIAACSATITTDEDATTTTAMSQATSTTAARTTTTEQMGPELTFTTQNWPPLQGGYHYEGWAIVDGAPVSTGKFNVGDGEIVALDGSPIAAFSAEGLEAATVIVITIEPPGDVDQIPADTHFLAGDLTDMTATLTIGHPAALGTDFAEAAGTFLLATPTDDDDSNELSGIWFLELPGPTPSLTLPELSPGWRYEGWAVIAGMPLTSGTFLTAAGADEAAPFSGPNPGPPFPGEDYLGNGPEGVTLPTDLSGGTVVISVEPYPDNDPSPFGLKPLIGMAAGNATDHESYRLAPNIDDLPTGVATISP